MATPVSTLKALPSPEATLPAIREKIVEVRVEVPRVESTDLTAGLTTESFAKPDGRMARSIQAFFMDQRSEHTRRAYSKDLKRFVKFLIVRKFERGVEPLDRGIIIAYKDWLLSEGLQHTTIDRHLATLRSIFQWLVDEDLLKKNPAQNVRFLNPRRLSKTNAFTDEEVRKVLGRPNIHTRTGAMHYAILNVLFYCGVRRSELCSIRTSHIAQERGHWVLKLTGKGNKERIIPIVPPVMEAIEYYLKITGRKLSGDEILFAPIRNNKSRDHSKPLDPSMIYYIVTRYSKEAGVVNKVSPHSCRATAISNARDHQASDRAIQEFAGWASPVMIVQYDKRKTAVEDSAAHSIAYGGPQQQAEGDSQGSDGEV